MINFEDYSEILSNIIFNAIVDFMINRDSWKGSPKELSDKLEDHIKNPLWLEFRCNPIALGKRLRLLNIRLLEAGICFRYARGKTRQYSLAKS